MSHGKNILSPKKRNSCDQNQKRSYKNESNNQKTYHIFFLLKSKNKVATNFSKNNTIIMSNISLNSGLEIFKNSKINCVNNK